MSHRQKLPPFVTPGSLPVETVWERYSAIADDPSNNLIVQAGGLLVELAVSKDVSETQSREYFYYAEEAFNRVTQNPLSQYPAYYGARLGSIFLPSYMGYRHGCAPTPQVRSDQRLGLCALMTDIEEAPFHGSLEHGEDSEHQPCFPNEFEKVGTLTKAAFLELCMGAGMDVLPYLRGPECDAFVSLDNRIIPTKATKSGTDQKAGRVTVALEGLMRAANSTEDKRHIISGKDSVVASWVIKQLAVRQRRHASPSTANKTGMATLIDGMGEELKARLRAAKV